jgi:hypothetical protein
MAQDSEGIVPAFCIQPEGSEKWAAKFWAVDYTDIGSGKAIRTEKKRVHYLSASGLASVLRKADQIWTHAIEKTITAPYGMLNPDCSE